MTNAPDRLATGHALQDVQPTFDVREFLAHLPNRARLEPRLIEKLRRKVEIARRVAAIYTHDLMRPVGPELLDNGELTRLFMIFLEDAEAGSVRSLNTVLKMADNLVPGPTQPIDPALAQRVARLVEQLELPNA